ncbi:MAG: hypothetical protein ABSC05_39260 [Candidatus Solibacter sp.]
MEIPADVSAPASSAAQVKDDPLALLKALAEASAVFLALTFIGGWSYLSSYYRTFGLNPLDFDFPLPVVCTIALYVLYEAVWPLFVGGIVVAILAITARRTHRLRREWIVAAICIVLVAVAAAGLLRGRQVADRDMLDDPTSQALPYVAFATKTEFKGGAKPSCIEWNSLGSPDCKLLMHYKSTYYFFKPVSREGQDNLLLYMLFDADLIAAHEQRGIDRNEKVP